MAYTRSKWARGVEHFAIVEGYRDPGPSKASRQRTLVSLGRHPTAREAYAEWEARLDQLAADRWALAPGKEPVKPGDEARASALEVAMTKLALKCNKLKPFVEAEVEVLKAASAEAEAVRLAASVEAQGKSPLGSRLRFRRNGVQMDSE